MIDPDGRQAFFERFDVPRETQDRLDAFAALVVQGSADQNLIASSTVSTFWHRHILDSAQVLPLANKDALAWLDVGSGAGLPGVVLAMLTDADHVLVEPRRLRADFLASVVGQLGLSKRVSVIQNRVEKVRGTYDVVTARAFASLAKTLEATVHLAHASTQWILHKGQSATEEIHEAKQTWAFEAELTPSLTDARASIVSISHIQRRSGQ